MNYFVTGADGRQYGPVDVATLAQWARQGRILADTVLTPLQGDPVAARLVLRASDFTASPAPERRCLKCRQPMDLGPYCLHCGAAATQNRQKPPLTGSVLWDQLLGLLPTLLLILGPTLFDRLVSEESQWNPNFFGAGLALIPLLIVSIVGGKYPALGRGVGCGMAIGCVGLLALGVASVWFGLQQTGPFTPIKICQ